MNKNISTEELKKFLKTLYIMEMVEETEDGYKMKHDLRLSKAMIIMDYLTIKELIDN